MEVLEAEHGFDEGSVEFAFIDHDKDAYLPDLQRILERRWLKAGSIVVGDNIKFPGAPDYRAFMAEQEGLTWRTVEHETHVEYQSLLKDLLLESEYLGVSH
jgi:catechol O-methyltransferase